MKGLPHVIDIRTIGLIAGIELQVARRRARRSRL